MRRVPTTCGVLLIAGLLPAAAAAQEVRVPASEALASRPAAPPALAQPAVTLTDAVASALRHNTDLLRGAARVLGAEGRLRESRGLFDSSLRLSPSADFQLQELTAGLRLRERNKRDSVRGVRNGFLQTGLAYRGLLAGDLSTVPPCPALFGRGSADTSINLDQADPTEVALSGVDRNVSTFVVDLGGGLDTIVIERVCRAQPRLSFSAEAFAGLWRETARIIDFTGGQGLEGALLSASQITRETYTVVEEIARTVAQRADLSIGRLGEIPQDEFKRNFQLDASFSKPLRNGSLLRADFALLSQEHHFVGKPLDPSFGGFDVPHMFFSGVTGTIVQPLGRGRGAKAAAALERSAEALAGAARDQQRHDASAVVLRTLVAYLNVVGAQERVRLLEQSRDRHAEILRVTEQRVASADIAQIETERVRAHEAAVLGALSQAQVDLLAARLALADAMGVTVTGPDTAPTATEGFSTTPVVVPDIGSLIAQARAQRYDTRAAAARRAAASALLEGALTEARPRLDLTLTVGMSNLYESPFFRFLPDEQEAIIDSQAAVVTPSVSGTPVPPESPVRYWDLRGYSRALTGRYEPYVRVGLAWELPFGNNRAKGRAMRAQASLDAATIDVVSLDRTVDEDVVADRATIDHAARAVAEWETAVGNSQRTFDSQQRLLGAGSVTVIDVLLTEEALARDQLELLVQRQSYLTAIGRLKFDLGQLLLIDAPGLPGELLRFLSTDFTGR